MVFEVESEVEVRETVDSELLGFGCWWCRKSLVVMIRGQMRSVLMVCSDVAECRGFEVLMEKDG